MKEIKLSGGTFIEVRADGDVTVVRIAVPDRTRPPQLPPADVPRYRSNRLATDEDIERILNAGEKPKTKHPSKCGCAACRPGLFDEMFDGLAIFAGAMLLIVGPIYLVVRSFL